MEVYLLSLRADSNDARTSVVTATDVGVLISVDGTPLAFAERTIVRTGEADGEAAPPPPSLVTTTSAIKHTALMMRVTFVLPNEKVLWGVTRTVSMATPSVSSRRDRGSPVMYPCVDEVDCMFDTTRAPSHRVLMASVTTVSEFPLISTSHVAVLDAATEARPDRPPVNSWMYVYACMQSPHQTTPIHGVTAACKFSMACTLPESKLQSHGWAGIM